VVGVQMDAKAGRCFRPRTLKPTIDRPLSECYIAFDASVRTLDRSRLMPPGSRLWCLCAHTWSPHLDVTQVALDASLGKRTAASASQVSVLVIVFRIYLYRREARLSRNLLNCNKLNLQIFRTETDW